MLPTTVPQYQFADFDWPFLRDAPFFVAQASCREHNVFSVRREPSFVRILDGDLKQHSQRFALDDRHCEIILSKKKLSVVTKRKMGHVSAKLRRKFLFPQQAGQFLFATRFAKGNDIRLPTQEVFRRLGRVPLSAS